jgi:Lipocalin-like domain
MPRLAPAVAGLALAASLAIGGFGSVSAATPATHAVIGPYTVKIAWTNPTHKGTGKWTLKANGTLMTNTDDSGTWSVVGKKITIVIEGAVTFIGKVTATGLSTKAKPGHATSDLTGQTGTWYALYK